MMKDIRLTLSCPWAAKYDLSNFNDLYLKFDYNDPSSSFIIPQEAEQCEHQQQESA